MKKNENDDKNLFQGEYKNKKGKDSRKPRKKFLNALLMNKV